MRRLVEIICDEGSVLEIQPEYGRAMVTSLAFLGGRAVAIVANDPSIRGGSIDTPAAHKGSRFLEVASAFHLPVIFLADNPGVMAGTAAEQDGALRAAARMFAAQHRLRVPKISVTLRKAFGFGSSIMAMNPFDEQTLSLALPGVSLGAMPARGGGAAAGVGEGTQSELDAAESVAPTPSPTGWGSMRSSIHANCATRFFAGSNSRVEGLRETSSRSPGLARCPEAARNRPAREGGARGRQESAGSSQRDASPSLDGSCSDPSGSAFQPRASVRAWKM